MFSDAARPVASSLKVDKKDVPRLEFRTEAASKDDTQSKKKHKR